MSRLRQAAYVVVAAFVALLCLAGPAAAHSELVGTTPSSGAVLDSSPASVELRFNQPVEASLGAIRLFDREAQRLEVGAVTKRGGDVVSVSLPELSDGGYVVTWRVTSADSHPIQGAFTFRVGSAAADGDDAALAARLLAQTGGSQATGLALAISRWLALAGLIVLVGGGVFAETIDVGAGSDRVVGRVLWSGWIAATVGTVGGLLAQGPYIAALPLSSAFDPDLLSDVLATRFGTVWAARLVLLAVAAVVLLLLRRSRDRIHPALLAGAAVTALALLATPALSGHAAAGPWAGGAVVLDVVHLAAVSTWIGGLVVLAVARLRRSGPDPRATVARFSRVAFVAVGVVLVTGVAQSLREIRPFDSLTSTTYGGLLIAKIAAFVAVVGIAVVSRRWVQGRIARAGEVGVLRRAVGAEVGVAAVVLVLTSLLVTAPPARVAYAKPFSQTLRTEKLWIDVSIEPAKAGRTDVHVYTYLPGGSLTPVEDVALVLRLPAEDIGPLEVPVERAGPSHFSAYGFDLPLRGRWTLEVTARMDAFEQTAARTEFDVR